MVGGEFLYPAHARRPIDAGKSHPTRNRGVDCRRPVRRTARHPGQQPRSGRHRRDPGRGQRRGSRAALPAVADATGLGRLFAARDRGAGEADPEPLARTGDAYSQRDVARRPHAAAGGGARRSRPATAAGAQSEGAGGRAHTAGLPRGEHRPTDDAGVCGGQPQLDGSPDAGFHPPRGAARRDDQRALRPGRPGAAGRRPAAGRVAAGRPRCDDTRYLRFSIRLALGVRGSGGGGRGVQEI
ncbi:MAG: hypothetical protein BWZ08_01643 [candidate division BRC1 bacterium ADurb.BinA292]|nr:MAG: hypothetical protein BWZ08_01643 [candidate division BRC1 bacterium ADurb.BinA292]